MNDSPADVLNFYASPGPLTKSTRSRELLEVLPTDLGELTKIVQGIGVYDVVAPDFYGIDVPENRRREIHYRDIDDMLAGVLALDDAPLTLLRPPERRLLSRCGGFTRLVVAALRAHGRPARARCGFAAYLNPGRFEDHWIAEVWDAAQNRWRLIDAQIDAVWRDRLDIKDDVLNLARGRFLVAAEAWKYCRAGEEDLNRFGITFAGLHGLWFVAGTISRHRGQWHRRYGRRQVHMLLCSLDSPAA